MSYYSCKYCGGPASWFGDHCWRCADAAIEDAGREGARAADESIKVFRKALGLPEVIDTQIVAPTDGAVLK